MNHPRPRNRATPARRLAAAAYLGVDVVREMFGANRRPHILLACMPKSASTYLAAAIAALPGFRAVSLVPAAGRREQELSRARLARANRYAYVAQHHVCRSRWTQVVIDEFRLTPVVLVRDLFDVTISLRDHLRRESTVCPMGWFEPAHAELPDDELELMIAHTSLPWYVKFYMSWRAAPGVLMLDYEDVTGDPAGTLALVAHHAGIAVDKAALDAAAAAAGQGETRFNVGGRGRDLAPAAAEHIRALLGHYRAAADDPFVRRMLA